jgi:DNA-binding transcriptional ArsR family regulator
VTGGILIWAGVVTDHHGVELFRVNMDSQDMGRVRFVAAPAPLLEVTTSIRGLRRATRTSQFAAVQRRILRHFPDTARLLLDLIPENGRTPTFLEPLRGELRVALETVRSTPAARIRDDVALTLAGRRAPAWIRGLTMGEPSAMRSLLTSLNSYFIACLLPYWQNITEGFEAEINRFAEVQLEHGSRAALEDLHPNMRWRGDTLDVETDADLEISPKGEGIVLAPVALWREQPLVGRLPGGAVPIAYPARNALLYEPARSISREDGLANLVGHTRARMLHAPTEPCGTAELARRVARSAAATSEHASVLRSAGLIVTIREGRGVQHALTRLGRWMLYEVLPPDASHR